MKVTVKNIIKSFLEYITNLFVTTVKILPAGGYLIDQIIFNVMNQKLEVNHLGVKLSFSVPTRLNKYRADSFSTKEPETLEWFDSIDEDSIVWDVGANIGLYTCYSIKRKNCKVFAFEPSVFNLELLARNIYLNDLADKVTIIPLPLSNKMGLNKLNMTNTEWGGALSTFGKNYGHDGKSMNKVFDFPTVGISMADAVEHLNIPEPDYIKMDVDGIEHLILEGGVAILSKIKGIIIEINDNFTSQSIESEQYLKNAGLTMVAKRHGEEIDEAGDFGNVFNQIWLRKDAINNDQDRLYFSK